MGMHSVCAVHLNMFVVSSCSENRTLEPTNLHPTSVLLAKLSTNVLTDATKTVMFKRRTGLQVFSSLQ